MFQKNVSLKPYNTFGIDVIAEKFVEVKSAATLSSILAMHKDVIILSGGSNILLTKDLSKPVVLLKNKGIKIIERHDEHVIVQAQAGENWHEFVMWCLENNFGGLENLSLIPGNVGTSPMQNIGAYGVEIKDSFVSLEAMEIQTGNTLCFNKEECAFGYRESVFKNELKGQYVILNVTFKLSTKNHVIKDGYGVIKQQLKEDGVVKPTIQNISDAVIKIRRSKLPDPKEIGNSGSFFKNPVISEEHFKKIQSTYPDMPFYKVSEELIKVPAGWLVEISGFKGKRFGDAGVHKNQALVLVNYDKATGSEVLEMARKIQSTVRRNFNISLEMEVNIL
ncbi:UDP-N-acetylmuramate dehydrogenase [Lutimonas zeaxanthinifaciens]|uniref:UDP-N-acetylmuramate dehydrogenase n=1 Tax=Lutimonas zeaxanthinifaciens TaxID=3060215 RepID=UPI00265CCA3B|nr:UDP-N-acetylmuramate dehydrogenase [Lutimonas sp. YSD2104]WKK64980.1 UDP-N-acetylmuramate dehydrogenase [Lutimonas sp. YSD2104]